jgi:TonB family protein
VTAARGVAFDLAGIRRRELRRALVVSAAAHVVLLLGLISMPETRPLSLPGVIAVDLVAAPSRPAAPAPVPAAKPVPKPPAPKPVPKPVPKKVVLPAETTLPSPRPREVEPEPAPEPVEEAYEDVLAGLRAEMGETAPTVQEATPEPGGSGLVAVSPEVAAWVRRAKIHVRSVWVVPPGFRTQPLQTSVRIELDAAGRVLGQPRVMQGSGNYHYDDGVVRAIRKASPLPAPPEAGEWTFVFVPEDSY